jgi:pSer/pThr/pTyr-binding forkhead associated (FHA) protein
MTSELIVFVLRVLLAALLYGFLGWGLVTIWRDLRAQGQFLSKPNIPGLSISKLGDESVQSFATSELVIGRSTKSDYLIANDTVSARHARLSYHHNQWWAEDLNSMNGTYLNDERLSMPTVIISGDELRCGKASLCIKIEELTEK